MWELRDPKDLRIVVLVLRGLRNWDNLTLSAASGVSRNKIAEYLAGDRAPSRRTLERLAAAVGFPRELLDPLISLIRVLRLIWEQAPGRPETLAALGRKVEALPEDWSRSAGALYLAQLGVVQQDEDPEKVRRLARDACSRLMTLSVDLRRVAVPLAKSLHTWGVVELLCAESEGAAAHSAGEALELSELALLTADQLPPSIRSQAQGYAWSHMGNSHRVGGELPTANKAFGLSASLWQAGVASGSPCPLDGSRLLDLEASLRREERQPLKALTLLDRAIQTPGLSSAAKVRLLIKKSNTLEVMGEYQQANAALHEAAPAVENSQDTRLLWLLRCGQALSLCFLERAAEANDLLPAARSLAAQIGNDLDGLRFRWLESRVAAGLGRTAEAIEVLSGVRARFIDLKIAYDAALATSELAAHYLQIGRTAEVKALVRQSVPIFCAEGIYPEAQKALALFSEAVEHETVTFAVARRLVTYLQRAQHDASVSPFEA
jgi:tetratricopeptide (TPR) repeat protein